MSRNSGILMGWGTLLMCLCFVGACTDEPKAHVQTESSGLKDAPALLTAYFKQTMKEARTYASKQIWGKASPSVEPRLPDVGFDNANLQVM